MAVETAGPFPAVSGTYDTAGPFSAVSLKQLKAGRGDYRTLPYSVSEQLKTLEERHGRPQPFLSALTFSSYWLHLHNQSDVSFIVILSVLHNHLLQCMRGVNVLAKHSS